MNKILWFVVVALALFVLSQRADARRIVSTTAEVLVYGETQPMPPATQAQPAAYSSPTPVPTLAYGETREYNEWVDIFNGVLESVGPWTHDGQYWRQWVLGVEICIPGHLAEAERDTYVMDWLPQQPVDVVHQHHCAKGGK